jgi:hypothetical protein
MTWLSARREGHRYDLTRLPEPRLCWQPEPVSNLSGYTMRGIHPKIVQERLGPSTISMTLDIYSHMAPGLQEAAARSFDTVVNPEHEEELLEINS